MRFPDTITRKRQAPGDYNDYGEFVEGAVTETDFRASVQPLGLEDKDLVEGARFSHRLKVFVPVPGALAAAFEDREADTVLVNGGEDEYVVEESATWRRHHTMATLLREV